MQYFLKNRPTRALPALGVLTLAAFAACSSDPEQPGSPNNPNPPNNPPKPKDPATAPKAMVDRFSAQAGMLMVRSDANGLPGPNAPVNFDQPPFVTLGLGPDGESARYYNFDVQSTAPAPIYVLFEQGASEPVAGQLNIIDALPGEAGYSDFWAVHKVTVPANYVANTVTSLSEIMAAGYAIESTTTIVNCPVVPDGSTASLRIGGGSSELHTGWYRGQVVKYFTFEERALSGNSVPLSPIYVMFNINPDQAGGGPASGFRTEAGSDQTHNVLGTLPSDQGYSPLWSVNVVDNADFARVRDLASASAANVLATGVATVNCPVVAVQPKTPDMPKDPAAAPRASVDRFSATAGTLMVRDGANGLPAANAPINFDQAPFITKGLGPTGEIVRYYNFDVQTTAPAPIYVLFKSGSSTPVPGQLNIIDVIPGDTGYNDFWRVHKVTVPDDYVANTVTSKSEIEAKGFPIEMTTTLVNCPVVPAGSVASRRIGGGAAALETGWYRGNVVFYFTFSEKGLSGTTVPLSPIYVMFNVNPDQAGGGPGSGFRAEPGTDQTHNVVATVPTDASYSPLWSVQVLDNAAFDGVSNLATAASSTVLGANVATVNCPVVSMEAREIAVPTEPSALLSFLQSETYKNFPAEPAVHASTGPHGRVRTFINSTLRTSLMANTPHAVGAASVKELYSGNTRVGWAVLVKVDANSDNGQGFYWYEYLNGAQVISGRGVGACTGCHSAGSDYVLTPPF